MHMESLLLSSGASEQDGQRSDLSSAHNTINKEKKCVCFSRLFNRYQFLFDWIGDLVLLIAPIGAYILDIAFDVMLIVEYLHNEDWLYSGLTFAFMAIPALVISIISGINYYQRLQLKRSIEKYEDKYNLKEKFVVDSNGRFIFRFLFTFVFLSPVAS